MNYKPTHPAPPRRRLMPRIRSATDRPAARGAAITVDDLTVVHGRIMVLQRLSLKVGTGLVTGLLGPVGIGQDDPDAERRRRSANR